MNPHLIVFSLHGILYAPLSKMRAQSIFPTKTDEIVDDFGRLRLVSIWHNEYKKKVSLISVIVNKMRSEKKILSSEMN